MNANWNERDKTEGWNQRELEITRIGMSAKHTRLERPRRVLFPGFLEEMRHLRIKTEARKQLKAIIEPAVYDKYIVWLQPFIYSFQIPVKNMLHHFSVVVT